MSNFDRSSLEDHELLRGCREHLADEARQLAAVLADPTAPVANVGLALTIGEQLIPIQLPETSEQRQQLLDDAVNSLSNAVVQQWTALYQAASQGKAICDAAVAAANIAAQAPGI